MEKSRLTALSEGVVCILGIWLFALFIQRDDVLKVIAYGGLLLAAYTISRSGENVYSFLKVFGINRFSRKVMYYILAGLGTGSFLAILWNLTNEKYILPPVFTKFAIIAPLIGITEELVFRGYVQTRLEAAGSILAVILASAAHTIYKYLVISTLSVNLQMNFTWMLLLTFTVGIVFGFLRERSGSVAPALLAHAIFDVLIYGGEAVPPVWVWS